MLTLEINDKNLAQQLTDLLNEQFDGDSEKMIQAFIQSFIAQNRRLDFSGIITWETDGLTYQKGIRREWQ